jgi:hypothetical protein
MRPLALAIAIVAVLGVTAEVLAPSLPPELVGLLSLSYEGNLPTWFASALLLLCALELQAIAARADTWRRHWYVLAIGFAIMSADEVVGAHELLSTIWSGDGALRYGWVVFAGALVVAIGAAYLPFLRALPPPTRRRFVLAAILYVGGAVVLELPLGLVADRYGEDGLAYALVDAVEETLELAGAGYFLATLRRRT